MVIPIVALSVANSSLLSSLTHYNGGNTWILYMLVFILILQAAYFIYVTYIFFGEDTCLYLRQMFCKHKYIYETYPEWKSRRCDKCKKYKVLARFKQ